MTAAATCRPAPSCTVADCAERAPGQMQLCDRHAGEYDQTGVVPVLDARALAVEDTAWTLIDALTRHTLVPVTDEQRQAATALLADLYAAGERHGIDPEEWANVTALPSAALDVVRATERRGSS